MPLAFTRDAGQFAREAGALVAARIEYNVMATVLAGVLAGEYAESPLFAYAADRVGAPGFAALRQPPWALLVTDLGAAAAGELIAGWLEIDPELEGVSGPPAAARAIAAAWAERTGGVSRCRMREAMHALEEVHDPPRPAAGTLRPASAGERELLIGWTRAFVREAGVAGEEAAQAMVDLRLDHDRLFVWDHHGPVSMVGTAPVVGAVARVGPVYTPPAHRCRGYAGSAVAAVSRRALVAGARRCVLFTDLANPTSNKIYAELGYRRVTDWEEHEFARGGTP